MNTKPWFLVAVVAVVGLAGYYLLYGDSGGVAVDSARVTKGSIRQFVDEQAKTRLPQTYLITMPFTGRIEDITLKEGDRVKQGDLVARIVPRDLDLTVQQAHAAVQRLDASLRENADVTVEETAYRQSLQFVKSTEASVQAAAERVVSGKAKLDYSTRDLARVQRLVDKGAQSQDDVERSLLQRVQSDVDYKQDQLVHAAMLAFAAATDLMPTMVRQYIQRKTLTGEVLAKQKAEAEVRMQQVLQDQERGTMRTPVGGVVLERFCRDERYLAAGTSLLEIGRLEDLEVEADLLTLDVVAVQVGNAVEIYGPAIGRPSARGTVTRVFPAGFTKLSSLGVEQQRVKVIIRFADEDLKSLLADRRLGVGYRVRARIFTADKSQALLVPRSALFRAADNSWQVFAVREGLARLQNVTVGLMNDEQAEIAAGLSEGEAVILAPETSLVDGTRVKLAGAH